jgi:hypothetical protein
VKIRPLSVREADVVVGADQDPFAAQGRIGPQEAHDVAGPDRPGFRERDAQAGPNGSQGKAGRPAAGIHRFLQPAQIQAGIGDQLSGQLPAEVHGQEIRSRRGISCGGRLQGVGDRQRQVLLPAAAEWVVHQQQADRSPPEGVIGLVRK